MKVSAKLNNLRMSPRKSRLLIGLIKSLDVDEALNQLNRTVKGSGLAMRKLLESAISNGENNFGIDRNNMYVYDIIIGAGTTLKRWIPKAYGRAGKINKRTSQIELILEERVEGKDRKSKEQMAKEKEERLKEKRRLEKEAQHKEETKEKLADKDKTKDADTGKKPIDKKFGIASRIFRRKSM